jgi:hypothetical protein
MQVNLLAERFRHQNPRLENVLVVHQLSGRPVDGHPGLRVAAVGLRDAGDQDQVLRQPAIASVGPGIPAVLKLVADELRPFLVLLHQCQTFCDAVACGRFSSHLASLRSSDCPFALASM